MSQSRVSEEARKDRDKMKASSDSVVIASDESFPASDPPSWTGIAGPGESHLTDAPGRGRPQQRKKRR